MVLRARLALAAGAALALIAWAALAADPVTVVQTDRSFAPKTIEIAKGTVVHFANRDEFIHQIYINSPTMHFDSAEQEPGSNIELAFPTTGTFEVRCHIHPKMRLDVTVK
ncbi:MAG: cupredoxin domain-containing protein [Parvibaculaceae bacterium]